MKQAAVNWLVYGEWGVPLWAAALGGAVFLAIALRWIAVEKRNRKGFLARCLPWTLSLFLILVALFVWHPVVVRITSWEVPARVIVLADDSASMNQPMAGADVESRLQALQFWQPSACEGRPVEARQLLAALRALRVQCAGCVGALDQLESQAEQGIPPDETLRLRQAELAGHLRRERDTWVRLTEKLGQDLDSTGAGAGARAGIDAYGKALDAVLVDFETRPPREAAEAVRTLMAAMTTVEPVLAAGQSALDKAYMDVNAARLEPLMKEFGGKSRREAVRKALQSIGSPAIVPEPYDGSPEATDLYGLVERALNRYRNDQVSQVVLLSDGGHNGPADDAVLARLKDEKIRLQVWGVGAPEGDRPDFGVIDWSAPLIARAGRTIALQAQIRTAAPSGTAFTVRLAVDKAEAANAACLSDGQRDQKVMLSFKAPAAGRHTARIQVRAAADRDAVNDAAQFGFESVDRTPDMLLIGSVPDWDAAYLRLAAERVGVKLTGVFTEGKAPRRGSVGAAVPEEEGHWFRNQAVILGGRTFPGFSDRDADALYTLVTEKGGTLMIFPEPADGYAQALAARFGWTAGTGRLVRPPLRLPAAAARLPLFRLGVDAAQSERLFGELGPCQSAVPVPAQDRVLVETASGEPVCSIGFYGRGKVVLWGLQGLAPMREYDRAARVDRLLDALVSEIGTPVFAAGQASTLSVYPALPAMGTEALLIQAGTNGAAVLADGKPVAMTAGHGNRLGRPVVAGPVLTLAAEGATLAVTAENNPGLEQLFPEFNPALLEAMAAKADGEYRALAGEANPLRDLAPGRAQIVKTSDVFRVGGHPALFLVLVLAATLHWALRKLAGLVI
jgi:hypothetical protein